MKDTLPNILVLHCDQLRSDALGGTSLPGDPADSRYTIAHGFTGSPAEAQMRAVNPVAGRLSSW